MADGLHDAGRDLIIHRLEGQDERREEDREVQAAVGSGPTGHAGRSHHAGPWSGYDLVRTTALPQDIVQRLRDVSL